MNFFSKLFSETFVAAALVFVLIWFVNPLDLWMTDMFHMSLLGVIVALFAVFAMFLWREGVLDEREEMHRYIATRFAYIAGGSVLLVGIIVQAFAHAVDPWMPFALVGMVLAKIIGRWYAARYC